MDKIILKGNWDDIKSKLKDQVDQMEDADQIEDQEKAFKIKERRKNRLKKLKKHTGDAK